MFFSLSITPLETIALFDGFSTLRSVVVDILTLLTQVTALLMALAIASGFLEAQIGYMTGAPTLLSNVWAKIGSVVICVVIALAAVPISNALVSILAGLF